MNILVVGDNGQVGISIRKFNKKKYKLYLASKFRFSENSFEKNYKILNKLKIDIIINVKALTDVDKAEKQKFLAKKLNFLLVKQIVFLCKKLNIKLIHISTDFIFDGKFNKPSSEKKKPNPVNYYGQTKLMAENFIKNNIKNYIIIRTSKIYSEEGNNFLKKILLNLLNNKELNYIDNEYFCPTYSYDLVKLIFLMIRRSSNKRDAIILNFTGRDQYTPYRILDLMLKSLNKKKLCINNKIQIISRDSIKLLALRPQYSILNNTKVNKIFGKRRSPITKTINTIVNSYAKNNSI